MRNTMKKTLTLAMAAVLILATGCGGGTGSGGGAIPPRIGILSDSAHPASEEIVTGFILAISESGYISNQTVIFVENDAEGQSAMYEEIAQQYVADEMDLVMAVGPDGTRAAAATVSDVPVLGAAVPDYVAAGLITSEQAPGGNVSGTTDMNPVEAQISLLKTLMPAVASAGILYTEGEAYSALQAEHFRRAAGEAGLEPIEAPVENVGDIDGILEEILSSCDALYIPEDEQLLSVTDKVSGAAAQAGIPVIVSSKAMVESGGLATAAIDYPGLGYQTGLMAVEIFKEGADPASMPIRSSAEFLYHINGTVAEALGIDIPSELATSVI